MRFGTYPLKVALGGVLAHSVALPKTRLRKGKVLDQEDITRLAQAGVQEVTVALLDADDVAEDAAAAQLATALTLDQTGLRHSNAFTGRVNLLAQTPGVALVHAEAIHAANAVDPMITVATVPPHQQMAAGGMVATIKIISYAVSATALAKACAAARGALGLAKPVLDTAELIITEIPGGAGEKGREAIQNRLHALNVTLARSHLVPHTVQALHTALDRTTAPLVLILTGSATSDPFDVAPAAVRATGGEVLRFGMPVDPGNLLFIGEKNGQQIIGLPGCARAPALNGADWVLSRIVCGIPVTAKDIAGMGVGGLLKEIPTRPQPRAGRKPS